MTPGRAGAGVLALAIGVWAALFASGRWGRSDPAEVLEWLVPAACAASMLGAAVAGIACRAEIWSAARAPGKRAWLLIGAAVAMALFARLALVPATERLYYDEHTYLQLARGIAAEGRASVASYGVLRNGIYHCEIGSYSHWSLGWPTALAAGFRLTGVARWTGRAMNLVLSLSSAILVALVAALLFPGARVCVAAAAIYACLPANQIWSRTSVSEVFAAFAAILAVMSAALFARSPNRRLGWLLAVSAALAAEARNETILLLPVCALMVLALGGRKPLAAAVRPGIAAVVLLWPQAAHLGYISRSYDANQVAGSGFSIGYVPGNLASVVQYLRGEPLLLAAIVLAVIGTSHARMGGSAWPLWAWLVGALLAPMVHFGGSYAFPGGERFALAWLPALSLAAACGLYAFHHSIAPHLPRWLPAAGWSLLYVAVLWTAGSHAVREDLKMAVPRRDLAFLRESLRSIPRDGVVVSSDPPAVIAEGHSTVFLTWAGAEADRLNRLAREHAGKLYYFESPSSSPRQWPDGPACHQRVMSFFRAEPVARESSPDGVRVLYRLRNPG